MIIGATGAFLSRFSFDSISKEFVEIKKQIIMIKIVFIIVTYLRTVIILGDNVSYLGIVNKAIQVSRNNKISFYVILSSH